MSGPHDPQEWLQRARSNLTRARHRIQGVYLEDLCFDAQQAAEKALKALLISLGVRFPRTHDLASLLTLIERSGLSIPEAVLEAAALTEYAVQTRYPGFSEPVTEEEYRFAVRVAEEVVGWVEALLKTNPGRIE